MESKSKVLYEDTNKKKINSQIDKVQKTYLKELINELTSKTSAKKNSDLMEEASTIQTNLIRRNSNKLIENSNVSSGDGVLLVENLKNNNLEHAQKGDQQNTGKIVCNLGETSVVSQANSDFHLTSSTLAQNKHQLVQRRFAGLFEQQQTVNNPANKFQQPFLSNDLNNLFEANVQVKSSNLKLFNINDSSCSASTNLQDRAVDSLIVNDLVDPNDLPHPGITILNDTFQSVTLTTESDSKTNSTFKYSNQSDQTSPNLSSYVSSENNSLIIANNHENHQLINSFKNPIISNHIFKFNNNLNQLNQLKTDKSQPNLDLNSIKCFNCGLKPKIESFTYSNVNMSKGLPSNPNLVDNSDYLKQLDVQQLNQLLLDNPFLPQNLPTNNNLNSNLNLINTNCDLLDSENSEQLKRFLCKKCRPNRSNHLHSSNKHLRSFQSMQNNSRYGWNAIKEYSKGSIKRLKKHQKRFRSYTRAMRKQQQSNLNPQVSNGELSNSTTQAALASILNAMTTNHNSNSNSNSNATTNLAAQANNNHQVINNFCKDCYIEQLLANQQQVNSSINSPSSHPPTVCLGCCNTLNGAINSLLIKDPNSLETNLSNKLSFKNKLNAKLFEETVDRYWDVEQWRNKLRKERLRKKERNILMVVSSVAIIIFIAISYFGTILFLRLTKMQNKE